MLTVASALILAWLIMYKMLAMEDCCYTAWGLRPNTSLADYV
jgi:hypothetical protein